MLAYNVILSLQSIDLKHFKQILEERDAYVIRNAEERASYDTLSSLLI
jgi:hypothetical protein